MKAVLVADALGNGIGVTLDVVAGNVPGVVAGTSAQLTNSRTATGNTRIAVRRSGERSWFVQTEEECIREMARCLREIAAGQAPK